MKKVNFYDFIRKICGIKKKKKIKTNRPKKWDFKNYTELKKKDNLRRIEVSYYIQNPHNNTIEAKVIDEKYKSVFDIVIIEYKDIHEITEEPPHEIGLGYRTVDLVKTRVPVIVLRKGGRIYDKKDYYFKTEKITELQ